MASEAELPMPKPTIPKKSLTSFKVVSYDIYGTLVDWEISFTKALQKLASRIPSDSKDAQFRDTQSPENRVKLAALFNDYEHDLQKEQPDLRYDKLLSEVYMRIARGWDIEITDEVRKEAEQFGQNIGSWEAFPDTVNACQRLSKHYKLVPLSNVDNASFKKTCDGTLKDVDFWRIYTAQDIGSYKPDLRNFEYLIKKVKEDSNGEVEKDQILHTAQSIQHDHVPAKQMGMSSVWINRKGAGMGAGGGGLKKIHDDGKVGYGWRFNTLGEFADEVDRAFAEQAQK